MSKIIRFTAPIILACVYLVVIFYLAEASSAQTFLLGNPNTRVIGETGILVTTLQDELNSDGDCSLREAIEAANTNQPVDACTTGDVLTDTITFGVAGTIIATNPFTVTTGGWLVVDGANVITISGGDNSQILYVSTGASLILKSSILTDGNAFEGGAINNLGTLIITNTALLNNRVTNTDTWQGGNGGGIYNGGVLTITNSTLSGNIAVESFGLTIEGGGGIYNEGILSITKSVLSSNSTVSSGGGILNKRDGKLNITNTILSDNSASNGGGIYNRGLLTITNSSLSGNSSGNNAGQSGGGIYHADQAGTLTIKNSIISANQSTAGGGIYNQEVIMITNSLLSGNSAINGGGIMTSGGYITITGSTLTENSAKYGGGIYNSGGSVSILDSKLIMNSVGAYGGGGGIYNRGYLYLIGSTMSHNRAAANLGSGGGIDNLNDTVIIENSALSDNYASLDGGAINNGGKYGSVTIKSSTLSGNFAGNNGGAILNWGTCLINNSTLSGNEANMKGGAILNRGTSHFTNDTLFDNNPSAVENFSSLTTVNAIIANSSFYNCNTALTDSGNNISSDSSCGFDPAKGSMLNTEPMLGPLQANGGPTWTHALMTGSPAIDAGNHTQCPAIDQRGMPRLIDGDEDGIAICDIGSYEYYGPPTQRLILTLVIKYP